MDYGAEHRDFNEVGCEKDRWANPVGDKESIKCHFPCGDPEPTTTTSIKPWTPTPVPNPGKLGPNPKVLIVGDSISHGQEGDFTWRFRISEWFKNYAPESKPTFVGYVPCCLWLLELTADCLGPTPVLKNETSLMNPCHQRSILTPSLILVHVSSISVIAQFFSIF